MPLSDWAAIGQLSRLRRLELSPEKDVHLDAECRSAGMMLFTSFTHLLLSLGKVARRMRNTNWPDAEVASGHVQMPVRP